jgi:AraC-like DNA-binding protein
MNKTKISSNEYARPLIQAAESGLSGTAERSGDVFSSRMRQYREFYSATGHTAAEYTRKRRLSNALAMIKASELPLADIAYECGFSSQQAMNRAVRERLNMTPLEYKSSGEYYYFPPPGELSGIEVAVRSERIPAAICEKYYSSKLIGIEDAAVGELLRQFPKYSGRVFGRDGKQRGARFCYELYLTEPPPGLAGFELGTAEPEHTSQLAITTAANSEERINDAWDALCNIWLPSSMFERGDKSYFEEYILKNGAVAKLRLYLPIRKRADALRFRIVESPDLRFAVASASGAGAERRASKTVMSFLTERYPHIAQSSREFCVKRSAAGFICGVRLAPGVTVEGGGIWTLDVSAGRYLVLESGVMGDYVFYSELLGKFARENSIAVSPECAFALYDASGGFDSPKMKFFRKIDTK